MNIPPQDQIDKLPKWAQAHIKNIEREREASIRALNAFTDSQTKAAYLAGLRAERARGGKGAV